MTVSEKLQAAKPVLGGAVLGAVAVTIIAFAGGWVVTANTMEKNVSMTRVSTLASVCEEVAREAWLVEGRQLDELSGFRNAERSELAKRFVPASAGGADEGNNIHSEVATACDRLLRT
ncbi:hypothetical protein [Fodinicurvata sediminis]|uniref:hypothetical protein n=1 Tax=Fodinicurvata sediminis TaxID=1121832 RepID=UPI0003B5E03F|nr:hypothetical protein [Fodinicurvata sediminis]